MRGFREFLLTAVLLGMLFVTSVHGVDCDSLGCGINARCVLRGSRLTCVCPDRYTGDPFDECYREKCNTKSDCPTNRACLNNKCIDPCLDFCGRNSQCSTSRHVPTCECPPRYTGNPYVGCSLIES